MSNNRFQNRESVTLKKSNSKIVKQKYSKIPVFLSEKIFKLSLSEDQGCSSNISTWRGEEKEKKKFLGLTGMMDEMDHEHSIIDH